MTVTTQIVFDAPSGHELVSSVSSAGVVTVSVRPLPVPSPVGVPGSWKLLWYDEFEGTSVDTSKWGTTGYKNNGMYQGSSASNVSVNGTTARLVVPGPGQGAQLCSLTTPFSVGDYIEFRVNAPADNWWSAWTSGPNWPQAGEIDDVEWLGRATTNYHDPAGQDGPFNISGTWTSAFHTYGALRKATEADIYWDGKLVETLPTNDNSQPQNVIITNGPGNNTVYGAAGALYVDYVRVWSPS